MVKQPPIHSKPFFSCQPVAAQPRGIERKKSVTPVRKSARLQERKGLYHQREIQEQLLQLPYPVSITHDKEVRSRIPWLATATTDSGQSVHRD